MRYELKSIGIWAFVKVSFFVNLAFGFLFGLFFALVMMPLMSFSMRMSGMMDELADTPSIGALVIILPFMFALTGAVFNTLLGALLVLIYNGLAKLLGGLEFDYAPVQEIAASPSPSVAQTVPYTTPAMAPTTAMPPPPPPVAPSVVAAQAAPQPEARPETLEETPPAPQEPDEDGPYTDET